MNKKTRNIIILIVLAVLCLGIFSACSSSKVAFLEYSKDDLDPIGKLILLMHGWIGNYGWTVVVFTLFLKLLMLPLDFWQRYSARKSSLKMQKMQPVLDSIDKKYGANTQRANEEKQKLYKKSGFSMMSTCLPMILSMVIFFVMFAGLRNYSTYSSITNFQNLSNTYYNVWAESIVKGGGDIADAYNARYNEVYNNALQELSQEDKQNPAKVELAELRSKRAAIATVKGIDADVCAAAEAEALQAVKDYYVNNHESWLWIQNVWQPDTWESIMPQFDKGMNQFNSTVDMTGYDDSNGKDTYDTIRNAVLETGERGSAGKWNGLMILPFLSIGLSFLSTFISQRMEKRGRKGEQQAQQNGQQAATNKMMMILMPLMMAYFGFIYTGAFAIYMVVNYMIGIITTISLRYPVDKIVEKRLENEEKKQNSSKASYMR